MKTYVKPDLVYENFELSHNVASGCKVNINHYQDTCKLSADRVPEEGVSVLGPTTYVFQSDNCDIDYKDVEIICAFSGSSEFNVFTS